MEISYRCVYKSVNKPVMEGRRLESFEDAIKEYKKLLEKWMIENFYI